MRNRSCFIQQGMFHGLPEFLHNAPEHPTHNLHPRFSLGPTWHLQHQPIGLRALQTSRLVLPCQRYNLVLQLEAHDYHTQKNCRILTHNQTIKTFRICRIEQDAGKILCLHLLEDDQHIPVIYRSHRYQGFDLP